MIDIYQAVLPYWREMNIILATVTMGLNLRHLWLYFGRWTWQERNQIWGTALLCAGTVVANLTFLMKGSTLTWISPILTIALGHLLYSVLSQPVRFQQEDRLFLLCVHERDSSDDRPSQPVLLPPAPGRPADRSVPDLAERRARLRSHRGPVRSGQRREG